MKTFTAYIEFDPESKLYVGVVPGIPGAHTQGASLDELQKNLKEVLELCLEEYQGPIEELPRFVGLQQIEMQCDRLTSRHVQEAGQGIAAAGFPPCSTKGEPCFLTPS